MKHFFLCALLALLLLLAACGSNAPALQPEDTTTAKPNTLAPIQTPTSATEQPPNPDAGISLGSEQISLFVGQSALIEAHCIPRYNDSFPYPTYESDNETVATVDQNGNILGVSAGTAAITVSFDGFSATCTVTVEKEKNPNPGIVLPEIELRLTKGKTYTISAAFTPTYKDESTKLHYSSDNTTVATVDANGKVTALAAGSANVTVRDESGNHSAKLQVNVPNSFSFLAAGDNLLHSGIYSDARERAGGNGYDFLSIYSGIASKVQSADFAMINQETVFTGSSPSSYPSLNAPQEAVKALADLGFDIVSLANNHCLDKGGTGLVNSMKYLDTLRNVIRLGGYFKKDNDAMKIRVIEKDGIKVALLAYTTFTNGDIPSDFYSAGIYVPWVNEENMINELTRAKNAADAVLVFMHWGDEEKFAETEKQKNLAQFLADNGADVIVGAHPHVIQSVEYITAADGKVVPCIYSLGTLVSNMATEQNMLSCLVSFDFVKGEDGKITIENIEMDPYVFYYDMEYENSALYRLDAFTQALADSHGVGNYPKNSSVKNTVNVERLYGYLYDNIAPEFLPDAYKKELN